MTDEQLRQTRALAEANHAKWLAQRDAGRRQAEEESRKHASDCGDFVFRQRNPNSCQFTGLYFGSPDMPAAFLPTVETEYDRLLFAHCTGIRTIAEARKRNCLPRR